MEIDGTKATNAIAVMEYIFVPTEFPFNRD